ncbi:hypothetical protein IG631_10283 [Alternaria alternata]|nr:hypothetical protein IG631_10283 [Alternaria alternata]
MSCKAITTPSAPSVSAAATSRPSAIPPDAMMGTREKPPAASASDASGNSETILAPFSKP